MLNFSSRRLLTSLFLILLLSLLIVQKSPAQLIKEDYKKISKDYPGEVIYVDYMYDFVVVSFGEQDGITLGTEFEVYCGSKKVATLEAVKVRKQISACNIKKLAAKDVQIKVGDSIRLPEKLEEQVLVTKKEKLEGLVREGKEYYKQQLYQESRLVFQEAKQIDENNKEAVSYLAKIEKQLAPSGEVGPRETGAYAKAGRHLVTEKTTVKEVIRPISIGIKADKRRIVRIAQQVLKENSFLLTELNEREGIIKAHRDVKPSLQEGLRSEFKQFEYKDLKFNCELTALEAGEWLFTIHPEIMHLKPGAYITVPVYAHSPYYNEALSIVLAIENRVDKLKER